jgi:hypothetical protein
LSETLGATARAPDFAVLNPGYDDEVGRGDALTLRTRPKKKAPNAGARLGGNPYMSLKSVTDSIITLGCKYVTSRTKMWKIVTEEER